MTDETASPRERGSPATNVPLAGWRPAVSAGLLGYAVACLLACGCTTEPSRSAPATSVRAEPSRAAGAQRAARARLPAQGSAVGVPATVGTSTDSPATSSPEPRKRDTPERGLREEPSGLDHERRALRPADERQPVPSASSGQGTASGAVLAPGVNEEFDEDVLLDIDDALDATDENAFATLFKTEKVLVDGELVRKEKSSHPDSCRRWRTLRARGYEAKSPTSRHLDAGALVRCGCLEFLARAKPSRVSHVRNLLTGASPSTLPALVASGSSPLALEARGRAVARGATLAELLPGARVIPSELPGRLSIAEPSLESTTILNAEVWGDINSDEVEDVVLSVLNTSEDGSFFELRLIQVTRTAAGAPLTVLGVRD